MNNGFSAKKIVYLSFLIALSIILTRLFSLRIPFGGVEGVRIGFGGLPIVLAGVVFGPVAGGIVGAISDVLGYMINPMGAYMPHFTLTSFLTGYIPGLVILFMFHHKKTFTTVLIATGIGQLISSVLLVPLFLQMLFNLPLAATLPPRIISQALSIPIYAYFIHVLMQRKVFNFAQEKPKTV